MIADVALEPEIDAPVASDNVTAAVLPPRERGADQMLTTGASGVGSHHELYTRVRAGHSRAPEQHDAGVHAARGARDAIVVRTRDMANDIECPMPRADQ